MASSSTQEAAKAINCIMKFSPRDQQSFLEVIDDYFTSNNGCDSESGSESEQAGIIHTLLHKTKQRIRILMDVCTCR